MTAYRTSACYDFGDILVQNHNLSSVVLPQNNYYQQQQQQLQQQSDQVDQQHKQLVRRTSIPDSTRNVVNLTSAALINTVSHLLPMLENIHQHKRLDRSQSEPPRLWPQIQPGVNSSRYKTELCRPYEESGSCKYGDKCQFAHGIHELRSLPRHPKYKTEQCRTFHSTGLCPYGPRCHFIHNVEEARAAAAAAAAANAAGLIRRPTPLNISTFSGSNSGTPSPVSSLSQSPTSSNSFFEYDLSTPPYQLLLKSPRLSPEPSQQQQQRMHIFNFADFTAAISDLQA